MPVTLVKLMNVASRGLRAAARWWPCWLLALVVFLANVPGEERLEEEHLGNGWSSNAYYYHGWPGTYLQRRGNSWAQPKQTDTCWQLRTGVQIFSGWILLGDLLVAGSLLAATALATNRLRPVLRPRFSLRGALLGLTVVSLLMAWGAKWRRDHLAMAQIAQTLSADNGAVYGSADCPTWLAEWLPSPPPTWLTELRSLDLWEPFPATQEDAARIERALELRPDCVRLRLDKERFQRPWRQFLGQVSACEQLDVSFFGEDKPTDITALLPFIRHFRNLRSLEIDLAIGDMWAASELLAAIPCARMKSLILRDACVTYDDLATIATCRDLERLCLSADFYDCEPLVTSNGLRQLQSLVHLKDLVLQGNTIQIDGSTSFAFHKRLRFLTVSAVVNDGWSTTDLEPLSELVGLDLTQTPITLADVQVALRLPRLKYLGVRYSGVDSAELQRLQQAHPHVQMNF